MDAQQYKSAIDALQDGPQLVPRAVIYDGVLYERRPTISVFWTPKDGWSVKEYDKIETQSLRGY